MLTKKQKEVLERLSRDFFSTGPLDEWRNAEILECSLRTLESLERKGFVKRMLMPGRIEPRQTIFWRRVR